MSFMSILETIFIGPLKLVFEFIFSFAYRIANHPGIAIIFLSLIMNILVLPLYRRADAMQEQSQSIEAKLQRGVKHIKQTFSGDERMMILQAYYRQNDYKPTNALSGSISLLLEIPFFMAAYQFLSHLTSLAGVSLGPIADLSTPDGMLVIGGIAINLLPFIMTAVNIISCSLYLKGATLKSKIQLYAMAAFFLVFLYTSPSGLVFYWTLNNLFSLAKNIFYKLKNPKKVIAWLCSLAGLVSLVYVGLHFSSFSIKMSLFLLGVGICLQFPLVFPYLRKIITLPKSKFSLESNKKLFISGCLFLTLLLGVLIPSNFIADSPQEYVNIYHFYHPGWYLVSSAALASGFFLVWMRVFYWLANDTGKAIFARLVWVLSIITFVNYMFFGTNTGVLSAALQFEDGLSFTAMEKMVNLAVIAVLMIVAWLLASIWKKLPSTVLLIAILTVGCMSGLNIKNITQSIAALKAQQESITNSQDFHINLSKNGQNVVVIMLDRAMGEYIPYFIQERPDLTESFSGFTYYKNTISHGGYTNFGVPGLMGGYEYTPVEMNKREDETLVSKHNEALKMMPRLFSENGYNTTVCNPPYANYQWIPDLSIYDDLENVDTYVVQEIQAGEELFQKQVDANLRNFFCLGLMKSMPLITQPYIYNNGIYHQIPTKRVVGADDVNATGISPAFMMPFSVLRSLPYVTSISEDSQNNFLVMSNDTTHEPILLQLPNYEPAQSVDNSNYPELNSDRVLPDGTVLKMDNDTAKKHYQTNMAALLQLANWMDYLKEQGVYDNTRIILVSDHGRGLQQIEALRHESDNELLNKEYYFPLLLVKDFNATEFTINDTFMTTADVPTLAVSGIIENPVNPYTGKPINSDEKTAHDQLIILSRDWDSNFNNGNTFLPAEWASVKDDLWNADNWSFYQELAVLNEHALPTQ